MFYVHKTKNNQGRENPLLARQISSHQPWDSHHILIDCDRYSRALVEISVLLLKMRHFRRHNGLCRYSVEHEKRKKSVKYLKFRGRATRARPSRSAGVPVDRRCRDETEMGVVYGQGYTSASSCCWPLLVTVTVAAFFCHPVVIVDFWLLSWWSLVAKVVLKVVYRCFFAQVRKWLLKKLFAKNCCDRQK